MKVESLPISNTYSKAKNSTAKDQEDNFSKLLTGMMNVDKEVTQDKPVEVEVEVDVEVKLPLDEVKEDYMDLINPFIFMLNIPLSEDKLVGMSHLEEHPLGIKTNEVATNLNLVEPSVVSSEKDNPLDISFPNFNLERISELEDLIVAENKLVKEPVVDNINLDTGPDIKLKNKNMDIDSNSSVEPISVEDSPLPKELVKNEELIVFKPKLEEKLDLKDQDVIGIDRLVNRNLQTPLKTITNNELIQLPKVVSNENLENIHNSIIHLIETTTDGKSSTMKVQLYPEELGAVNITLKMEDGKVIAKILVDDDYVKQLFAREIEKLSTSLKGQNINMEKIFVELNLNANSDSGQNQSRFEKQKPRFNFARESLEEITKEEAKAELGVVSILA